MASVQKLSSGNYRARAYLGFDEKGKQIMKSFTDPDEKIALSRALSYEALYKDKVDRNSFAFAMDAFLRAKEGVLSPSTLTEYHSRKRTLRKWFPAFCKKSCLAIDSSDLEVLIRAMQTKQPARHRKRSEPVALTPKTIQNYMRFISAVLRHQGLPMPEYTAPEKIIPDIYVPTDLEVRALIKASEGTDMQIPIMLAAFGPLRRGEICALQYPRDFDGNIIHVREASAIDRNHKVVVKQPKTPHSNRFIELPADVIRIIEDQGYVTRLMPDSISQRFKPLLRKAGLPEFRFHDLRHYCVSSLHAQGIPDAYIMQRGGWSTDSVLKSVYRHTLADQERKFSQKALDHFNSIFL